MHKTDYKFALRLATTLYLNNRNGKRTLYGALTNSFEGIYALSEPMIDEAIRLSELQGPAEVKARNMLVSAFREIQRRREREMGGSNE
jgi:hypothetical protein